MNIFLSIGHWILSNKRWSLIIVLSAFILGQVAYTNHLASKLNKASSKCEDEKAKIIAKQQEAVSKAIEKAKPVEIKYETDKAVQNDKTIETVKYITKTLKEPYYIERECFNNEFVSLYNSYINTDTAKPVSSLQESAKLN